jgi:hypothetical protein
MLKYTVLKQYAQKLHSIPKNVRQAAVLKYEVKLSRYTPPRRLGGEEIWFLLILDLGAEWGE